MRLILTAVPERAPMVDYLLHHLPETDVVWEDGGGAMNTFRRAWRTAPGEPHIHLQDDIVLTKDFRTKASAVIAKNPSRPIQFFTMRKSDVAGGAGLRPGRAWLMNQCYYLPGGMAEDIADFSEDWEGLAENPTADDTLMAAFFSKRKILYYVTLPSLVDHARLRSAINPKRSTKRQSVAFEEPEYEAFPEHMERAYG